MTSNKAKKLVTGGSDGGAGGAGFAVGEDTGKTPTRTSRKPRKQAPVVAPVIAPAAEVPAEQVEEIEENAILSPEDNGGLIKNEVTENADVSFSEEEDEEVKRRKVLLALGAVDARVSHAAATRNNSKYAFRKGDALYVKSLDLRGVVSNIYTIGGGKGYILDVISAKGELTDNRVMAMENDVVPVDVQPPQSEYDEARALVKSLISRFDSAASRFKQSPVYLHVNPLTNEEDADGIVGLQEVIVGVLDHKAFLNYFKDANIRRHYRALQNAMAALGGAYNIMADALKRIDALRESFDVNDLYAIRTDAQDNAYERIIAAGNFLKEALKVEPPSKIQPVSSPTTLVSSESVVQPEEESPAKFSPNFIKAVKSYGIGDRALKVRKGVEEVIDTMRRDDSVMVDTYQVSALRSSFKALQGKLVDTPQGIKGLFVKMNEAVDDLADLVEYAQEVDGGEIEEEIDESELRDTAISTLDEISNLLSDLDLELTF